MYLLLQLHQSCCHQPCWKQTLMVWHSTNGQVRCRRHLDATHLDACAYLAGLHSVLLYTQLRRCSCRWSCSDCRSFLTTFCSSRSSSFGCCRWYGRSCFTSCSCSRLHGCCDGRRTGSRLWVETASNRHGQVVRLVLTVWSIKHDMSQGENRFHPQSMPPRSTFAQSHSNHYLFTPVTSSRICFNSTPSDGSCLLSIPGVNRFSNWLRSVTVTVYSTLLSSSVISVTKIFSILDAGARWTESLVTFDGVSPTHSHTTK